MKLAVAYDTYGEMSTIIRHIEVNQKMCYYSPISVGGTYESDSSADRGSAYESNI